MKTGKNMINLPRHLVSKRQIRLFGGGGGFQREGEGLLCVRGVRSRHPAVIAMACKLSSPESVYPPAAFRRKTSRRRFLKQRKYAVKSVLLTPRPRQGSSGVRPPTGIIFERKRPVSFLRTRTENDASIPETQERWHFEHLCHPIILALADGRDASRGVLCEGDHGNDRR